MGEASQLYVFFSCLLCGAAGGVVYDILYIVKLFARGKAVRISLDILFFVLFAGIYIFISVMFALPAFRPYMFVACLTGLALYLKSVHIMLDFLIKTVYNIIKK